MTSTKNNENITEIDTKRFDDAGDSFGNVQDLEVKTAPISNKLQKITNSKEFMCDINRNIIFIENKKK